MAKKQGFKRWAGANTFGQCSRRRSSSVQSPFPASMMQRQQCGCLQYVPRKINIIILTVLDVQLFVARCQLPHKHHRFMLISPALG